jgi:SAM-dependent methyltransferase
VVSLPADEEAVDGSDGSDGSDDAVADGPVPGDLDAVGRARYLAGVMAEIDDEVRRRRSSGDLPPNLERDLDQLFLEFSPVGSQGHARLRETLTLVDSSAFIDIAVPVESQKQAGTYVKRLIRKTISWYMGFIVTQITKFGWAVSRMFHLVVDHVEELEREVATLRPPELPDGAVPVADDASRWWAADAVDALRGTDGRVVHADCGSGSLVALLVEAGVDAYGVDPDDLALEPAIDAGLDVRAEPVLGHLEVVEDGALGGIVLSGSVQWLHPADRQRVVELAGARLADGGVLVVHSSTPEAWLRTAPPLVADLAPGRPVHADTWSHLLAAHGLRTVSVRTGGEDRRLERVDGASDGAEVVNAAVDLVNELLAGPSEFVLVAARER